MSAESKGDTIIRKDDCPECAFRTSDVDLMADHLMEEHNETFRDLVLEGGAP